jgi:hypothetical protein
MRIGLSHVDHEIVWSIEFSMHSQRYNGPMEWSRELPFVVDACCCFDLPTIFLLLIYCNSSETSFGCTTAK